MTIVEVDLFDVANLDQVHRLLVKVLDDVETRLRSTLSPCPLVLYIFGFAVLQLRVVLARCRCLLALGRFAEAFSGVDRVQTELWARASKRARKKTGMVGRSHGKVSFVLVVSDDATGSSAGDILEERGLLVSAALLRAEILFHLGRFEHSIMWFHRYTVRKDGAKPT